MRSVRSFRSRTTNASNGTGTSSLSRSACVLRMTAAPLRSVGPSPTLAALALTASASIVRFLHIAFRRNRYRSSARRSARTPGETALLATQLRQRSSARPVQGSSWGARQREPHIVDGVDVGAFLGAVPELVGRQDKHFVIRRDRPSRERATPRVLDTKRTILHSRRRATARRGGRGPPGRDLLGLR